MKILLKQAVKIEGVPSDRTIKRDQAKGKISMGKDDKGRWLVDTAELSRVYQLEVSEIEKALARHSDRMDTTPRHADDNSMTKNDNEIIELRAEIKVLNEKISLKDDRIDEQKVTLDDLKNQRDQWQKQAQTLLLKAPAENPTQKPVESVSNSSGTTLPDTSKQANRWLKFVAVAVLILIALGIGYFMRDLKVKDQSDPVTQPETSSEVTTIEPASGTIKQSKKSQTVAVEEDSTTKSGISEHGVSYDLPPVSETEPLEFPTSPRD